MKKILLIEDNDEIRENTAEILELSNYKVVTAKNGKEGMETALQENPDLIICDIMMPLLDGYGVLHMLQKNSTTKNTPFIFLTAKSERTDFRKGMELGADDYIVKPFSGTELLNAIESRLKKKELFWKDSSGSLPGNRTTANEFSLETALKELIENRSTNRFRKKQIIYSEGNRPNCLYYLIRGKVKTYKINEEGKALVTDLYRENEFLGHIALLENTNYKESAEAIDETELAIIPKDEFEVLINSSPDLNKKFIQLLARNVSEKEEQLIGFAYSSLRKKVAGSLIALYRKYNPLKADNFTIDISRENLAAIAGTATESLIRTLSDFKAEKMIEIKEGIITILNEKKLENLLN